MIKTMAMAVISYLMFLIPSLSESDSSQPQEDLQISHQEMSHHLSFFTHLHTLFVCSGCHNKEQSKTKNPV
jgi:hypothetical protein